MAASDARARVLDAAERLFMEQGYAAVSMRDIAEALGVQQSALYYHAPKGKEQLFIEVVERNMGRQRAGLDKAIASAPPDLHAQLVAIAGWLAGQMPLDMMRMLRADAAQISPTYASQLLRHVSEAMMAPIAGVFAAAAQRGEIRPVNPAMLAGMVIAIVNWIAYFDSVGALDIANDQTLEEFISILLYGIARR